MRLLTVMHKWCTRGRVRRLQLLARPSRLHSVRLDSICSAAAPMAAHHPSKLPTAAEQQRGRRLTLQPASRLDAFLMYCSALTASSSSRYSIAILMFLPSLYSAGLVCSFGITDRHH